MSVLGAVAEFGRDLLIERTQAGLKRAVGARARLVKMVKNVVEQVRDSEGAVHVTHWCYF